MDPAESSGSGDGVDDLADELARRWTASFAGRDWPARLELLNQLHEQLLEDLGDLELYCAVSPAFIRRLVNSLAEGSVTSSAQAHIYANSDDADHRRAAGEWLAAHAPGDAVST